MTDFETGFIRILQAALTDKAEPLPENFDFGKAYELAATQNIVSLLYYGGEKYPAFRESPYDETAFEKTCYVMTVSACQGKLFDNLCRAFAEKGISFCPVKGMLLKNLYPSPDMRIMGDADILIKMEEYPAVCSVMTALGFRELTAHESNHELPWRHVSGLKVELHKALLPPEGCIGGTYYRDSFRLVKGNALSEEDHFVYLVAHFASHFFHRGAGARFILDFFVYLNAYPDMDMAYVREQLEVLGLLKFFGHLEKLLAVWFGGEESDPVTDAWTEVLLSCAVFGKREFNHAFTAAKVQSGHRFPKLYLALRAAFPTVAESRYRYPFLQKAPFLLPVAWVMRFFRVIFRQRSAIAW
ncbi:MAG: nucleotidyltransferase family protein, partial [Clostridia bacterium]|nr:nucleotidyltransferase family protein [Clostridia bacterium]